MLTTLILIQILQNITIIPNKKKPGETMCNSMHEILEPIQVQILLVTSQKVEPHAYFP